MSDDSAKLIRRWAIIKEQLIALCALNKLPKGNEEFKKFLSEDFDVRNVNSQALNSTIYYVLGIINSDERDKLIRWPLVNIKTHTGFRKGLSTMIVNLQKHYPWAHIKKLPVSYFVSPCGHQLKVVTFVSRIVSLAIHISLDDPELLHMHLGDGLNPREIAIMTEVIKNAREEEEKLMSCNLIPMQEVEDVINEICNKCIAIKQVNYELHQELNSLKKHALSLQIAQSGQKIESKDLKREIDGKLLILNNINEELLKYFNACKELHLKLRAYKNQSSLSSTNFGCQEPPLDLTSATSRVCDELCEFFKSITLKSSTQEQEEEFYNRLKELKETLTQQNVALNSLLCNISVGKNAKF